MNRFDEAKAVAETAISKKKDNITIHLFLYQLGAMQNDEAAMKRDVDWAAGRPTEAFLGIRVLLHQDALGQIKRSREKSAEIVELAKKYKLSGLPENVMGAMAIRDAFHGYAESARQKAGNLLAITDERFARANAALALAQSGDAAQAEKLTEALNKELPDDTDFRAWLSPAVQALNLMHRNKSAEAIAALEPARKYELGYPVTNAAYLVMYVRGLAYLQGKDGGKAAGEFQKILDHRGLSALSEFLPLAQLNLGRAYALQGDTAKARTTYQDFFAVWKDADADVPVLVAAKAEYAKLK
jgi:predicted Zn-dependent protease